ncbi:MAG: hypothetical protein ACI4PV_03410, partial [Butyricicoccus sp.]
EALKIFERAAAETLKVAHGNKYRRAVKVSVHCDKPVNESVEKPPDDLWTFACSTEKGKNSSWKYGK